MYGFPAFTSRGTITLAVLPWLVILPRVAGEALPLTGVLIYAYLFDEMIQPSVFADPAPTADTGPPLLPT